MHFGPFINGMKLLDRLNVEHEDTGFQGKVYLLGGFPILISYKMRYFSAAPQAAFRTPPLILDMISKRIKVITIIRNAMAAAIPNSMPRCQFK